MEAELGRYFEGRLYETKMLLKTMYDLGCGQGKDVEVWIEGRELVFGRGEEGRNRGFMRLIPQEISIILGFPIGDQLFDPKNRAKGPPGSQKSLVIRDAADLDPYVRRMISQAYALYA